MKMTLALDRLEWFLNNMVAGFLLIAMMVLVCCDVIGRYFFNQPVHGTLEIISFLLVGLVYFTLARTQAMKGHLVIDLFIMHLSECMRRKLSLFVYLVGMVLFALIAWQGALSAADAWRYGEVTDGLVPIHTFPSKAAVSIGSAVFVLRLLIDFLKTIETVPKKVNL